MFGLIMNVFVGLTLVTETQLGGLPEDVRWGSVRVRLEQMVQRAQAIGAPGELIASKVREGLAKNVAPALIEVGAARLLDGLEGVAQLLDAREQEAAPALVRALAEA